MLRCRYCKESFIFEKVLNLHLEKVHNTSLFSSQVSHLEQSLSSKTGQKITLSSPANQSEVNHKQQEVKRQRKDSTVLQRRIVGGRSREQLKKCSQCSFQTRKVILLLAHQTLEHPSTKPVPVFHCYHRHCWFPFSSFAEKTQHEKISHGEVLTEPFSCIFCDKKFSKKGKLYENHVELCMKRTVYCCPCSDDCSFKARKYSSLNIHVKNKHNEELSRYDKEQYEVKAASTTETEEEEDDVDIKDEPHEETISIDDDQKLEEIHIKEEAEEENTEVDILASGVTNKSYDCPIDNKKFCSLASLHKHVHLHHIDTGFDSLDCPFCSDSFKCLCGRETNNRDSFVLHSIRCSRVLELANTNILHHQEEDSSVFPGRLIFQRRAARKLREMGHRERLTDKDLLIMDQMKMVETIRAMTVVKAEVLQADEIKVEATADDEAVEILCSDDSSNDSIEQALSHATSLLTSQKRKKSLNKPQIKSKKSMKRGRHDEDATCDDDIIELAD